MENPLRRRGISAGFYLHAFPFSFYTAGHCAAFLLDSVPSLSLFADSVPSHSPSQPPQGYNYRVVGRGRGMEQPYNKQTCQNPAAKGIFRRDAHSPCSLNKGVRVAPGHAGHRICLVGFAWPNATRPKGFSEGSHQVPCPHENLGPICVIGCLNIGPLNPVFRPWASAQFRFIGKGQTSPKPQPGCYRCVKRSVFTDTLWPPAPVAQRTYCPLGGRT